ncbi:MAG TPA: hypothetical protein DHV12_06955 [Thermotogae bacterium]|nr:hypothetical protein [Thermotogota bacterium]
MSEVFVNGEKKQHLFERIKGLSRIFFAFSWVSLVALGGGYSMLSVYRHELVRLKIVSDPGEVLDAIARAQSLPGPIAVNFAAVMGKKLGGFSGLLTAVSGVVIPPILVIITLGKLLLKYREVEYLSGFLYGVRIVVVAMLASLVLDMLKRYRRSNWEYVLLVLAVVALIFDVPGVPVFLAMVLIGIFWRRVEE